ncbi:hypothetical protein DEO72_LG10g2761 [Vigna unguiculata]|uniref:Uncharacterized protein n=1 Tax=Vigna unguiculata TaxID=3917 RepID=A0A4D6NDU9_VIGUN|nr:hypothetical protein DEO72_LG10g2761 [Vigna unguiculata]
MLGPPFSFYTIIHSRAIFLSLFTHNTRTSSSSSTITIVLHHSQPSKSYICENNRSKDSTTSRFIPPLSSTPAFTQRTQENHHSLTSLVHILLHSFIHHHVHLPSVLKPETRCQLTRHNHTHQHRTVKQRSGARGRRFQTWCGSCEKKNGGLGVQRKPTTRLVAIVIVIRSFDESRSLRDRDLGVEGVARVRREDGIGGALTRRKERS